MTLREVLLALNEPDFVGDDKNFLDMEVEFCTSNRSNLHLLSVYNDEGKIIIDIGDVDE